MSLFAEMMAMDIEVSELIFSDWRIIVLLWASLIFFSIAYFKPRNSFSLFFLFIFGPFLLFFDIVSCRRFDGVC